MIANAENFMKQALAEADKAASLGEVPVGAVVVVNGSVVSQAHNMVEANQDATQHAEILAIQQASSQLDKWRLNDAALFVTLEPCTMCLGAILLSRIKEVYFGCHDPAQGACGSIFDLSNHSGLPKQTKVYPGVLESECQALIKEFFQNLRK